MNKEIIVNTPYRQGDRFKFTQLCKTWGSLCDGINKLSSDELIRLMKFIIEMRPNNRTYLRRIVSRYNALTRLAVEDIINEMEVNK